VAGATPALRLINPNVNLVQVEHALHSALRGIVASKLGNDSAKTDEILAQLASSDEPTCAYIEDMRFLELVSDCRARGIIAPEQVIDQLEEIVERQRSFCAAYGAETISLEGLKHRFKEFVKLPSETWERLQCGKKPNEFKSLLDLFAGEKDINRMLALLKLTGEVRDRNKRLLSRITKHRSAFLDEIAKRRNLSGESVRLYLLEELMRLLEDGLEVPEIIVSERLKQGVVLSRTEHLSFLDLQTKKIFFGEITGEIDEHKELRGLCASPGRYEGVVRVISSAKEVARMQFGDILVAKGTDFDLALLMRMAGAIVTEEGGLLSHAAVLARELAIPCLIEVTHATDILTDGENVCVDASAGKLTRFSDKSVVKSYEQSKERHSSLKQDVYCPLEMADEPMQFGHKAFWLAKMARAGLPVPEKSFVLPVRICETLRMESFSNNVFIHVLADDLSRYYSGKRLNLRSSSPFEDCSDRSVAGIFTSAIALRAEKDDIIRGLQTVVESASRESVLNYYGFDKKMIALPMAIIVSPYYTFSFQGTSLSQSFRDPERIIIECFEAQAHTGCSNRGGFRVSYKRSDNGLFQSNTTLIPHISAALLEVAKLTLTAEKVMGCAVEVEWGLQNHHPVLLQVRPVVTCESKNIPKKEHTANLERYSFVSTDAQVCN